MKSYFRNLLTVLLFGLLSIGFNTAVYAKSTLTLQQHIDRTCKAGCIDELRLLNYTTQAADKYNLDFRLLLAIIKVESGYRIAAKSRSNVGLMQLNLRYHKSKFSDNNYLDPKQNILAGAKVLAECTLKYTQSVKNVLRCYNGGGTTAYSMLVLKSLSEIKKLTFV